MAAADAKGLSCGSVYGTTVTSGIVSNVLQTIAIRILDLVENEMRVFRPDGFTFEPELEDSVHNETGRVQRDSQLQCLLHSKPCPIL